jgi:hypothetical protein
MARNITFAFPYLAGSNQTYHDLTHTEDRPWRGSGRSGRGILTDRAHMLKIPTQETLEKQRKERTIMGSAWSSNSNRWPLGDGQVRKDIEEDGEMEQEEWLWNVDLPM